MKLNDEPENLRSGFLDLANQLEGILKEVSKPQEILLVGAKEYVNDLKKLPRPYSQLRRTRSSHMLEVMGYRPARNNEVEVGSGVYWLRFVELGTDVSSKRKWKTPANPFMRRTFDSNKDKYYRLMLTKAGL